MSTVDPINATIDDSINEAALFHQGVEYFNTAEWFEAHEVWEDIWHLASGDKKMFYQGLIQAAVTIEHVRRGNPRGVRAVHKTFLTKFKNISGIYMGINVDALQAEVTKFVQPILDLPAERYAPELSRGQDLPADLNKTPVIVLAYDPFKN
jgi:hypothetical protein